MLAYELWETRTGNLMASYDTTADALQAVAHRAHRYGPDSVMSISLVQVDDEDDDGALVTLASGAELLARANQVHPLGTR